MPEFGGFTPDNYETQFNEEGVDVILEPAPINEAQPGANFNHPPSVLKNYLKMGLIDANKYEDKYGLRCYEDKVGLLANQTKRQMCYGMRDQKLQEYILINLMVEPYDNWVKSPMMTIRYVTKQYGGMDMYWTAHAKYFSHWQEIDHQIWQHIADWNVTNQKMVTQIKSQ